MMGEHLKGILGILSPKNSKLLLLLGIGGIVFIFLSSFLPKQQSVQKIEKTQTSEEYTASLEKRMEEVVAQIVGSKKVQVLITLDSGTEYVYANEVKADTDKVEDSQGDEKSKLQEKGSNEKKYVIVNSKDGGETPLTITEIAPRIRGVVVLCPVSKDKDIEIILSAVKTALDIPESKVCITGIISK